MLVDRKGIRPVKTSVLFCCWWWWFDWSLACLIAPVVTTTSNIQCSNEIQNRYSGTNLPGSSWKMATEWLLSSQHLSQAGLGTQLKVTWKSQSSMNGKQCRKQRSNKSTPFWLVVNIWSTVWYDMWFYCYHLITTITVCWKRQPEHTTATYLTSLPTLLSLIPES